MSINKTCSVPGEQSPLHAKAAFFWPCLGGHTQLTQLPHSELNTVSEGQEEVRTWSCKSIKQAMAGEMEDMKNKLPIQSHQRSFRRPPATECTVIECAPPGYGFTGSLCPAQCFINIRGNPSFHLFIFVSHFIRPYFQPRSPQWLANQQ